MDVRECRIAKDEDFAALRRMLELYQYEISDMYDQDLDASGEYGYDLTRHIEGARFFAHVLLVNNRYAQSFWRKVISSITQGRYAEVQVTQGWWKGIVQRFNYEAAA